MNDTDLAFASIEEIGKLFRKRKLSPVEITKLMLARIERLNPNSTLTSPSPLNLLSPKLKSRIGTSRSSRPQGAS